MTDHTLHLRPDELDLLLEGRLPGDRTSNIVTCEECRSALDELRDVVAQLNALPALEPPAGFSELVMASVRVAPLPVGQHLTADDLDAWLAGALHQEGRNHLWACTECRQLADAERALVYRLEQLPLFQPGARFEERVMAEVAIPKSWRSRIFASRRSVALAAGLGSLVVGSMGASVAWSLTHQDTLAALGTWATTVATQWTLAAAQGVGSRILAQPWVLELRSAASPGRIAALTAGATALYTGGLFAMRRLLALPAPRVARALP
jgi:hypothetical protein